MSQLKTSWQQRRTHPADADRIRKLAKEAGTNVMTASILEARGFQDPDKMNSFLHPDKTEYHDPFLFQGMNDAVERILDALDNSEKVAVYADYDADGTSAASILMRYFRRMGLPAGVYIPNRLKEGYGMNLDALKKLKDQGITLIITVDNGISSKKEAAYLKENGIDLIVTDHHEPPEELPEALALLDAKLKHQTYPFQELCGAGVAFKLVQALDSVLGIEESLTEYEQIAAIATVADLVSLTGENRKLVWQGLKSINQEAVNPGLKALVDILETEELTARDFGFLIGPMFNAPGRLGQAMEVVSLLAQEEGFDQKKKRAQKLYEENEARKAIELQIFEEAEKQLIEEGLQDDPIIVLWNESWHSGVIGIAASRIQEKYYKPVIIAGSGSDGILRGSCRSIEGIHIYDALKSVGALFESYGGHAQAAGFSIRKENLKDLREGLITYMKGQDLESVLTKRIRYDARITPSMCREKTVASLKAFEPCGIGNPSPNFLLGPLHPRNVRYLGDEGQHLSFQSDDLRLIGFRMGDREIDCNMTVAGVGNLELNCFKNLKTVQFKLKDIKSSPFQELEQACKWVREHSRNEDIRQSFLDEKRSYRPTEDESSLDIDYSLLKKFYLFLKKHPNYPIQKLTNQPGLYVMNVGWMLEILRQAGLISYRTRNGYLETECLSIAGKVNLSETQLFQAAQRISKE